MKMTDNYNILASLYRIDQQINKLSDVISTGKKINKASDDPTGLLYSQRMLAQMNHNKVANKNIDQAVHTIESIQDAIQKAIKYTENIREIAIAAQDPNLIDNDRWTLAGRLLDNIYSYYELTETFHVNSKRYLTGWDENPNINVGSSHFAIYSAGIERGGAQGINFGNESIANASEASSIQWLAEYSLNVLNSVYKRFGSDKEFLLEHKEYNAKQSETMEKAFATVMNADTAKAKSEIVKLQLLEENNLMLMQMNESRNQSFLKLLMPSY